MNFFSISIIVVSLRSCSKVVLTLGGMGELRRNVFSKGWIEFFGNQEFMQQFPANEVHHLIR